MLYIYLYLYMSYILYIWDYDSFNKYRVKLNSINKNTSVSQFLTCGP